jgi:hypothetical protein
MSSSNTSRKTEASKGKSLFILSPKPQSAVIRTKRRTAQSILSSHTPSDPHAQQATVESHASSDHAAKLKALKKHTIHPGSKQHVTSSPRKVVLLHPNDAMPPASKHTEATSFSQKIASHSTAQRPLALQPTNESSVHDDTSPSVHAAPAEDTVQHNESQSTNSEIAPQQVQQSLTSEEEPVLVIDSLASLLELAGNLTDVSSSSTAAAIPIEPGTVIEAPLEFSCMDPDTFARQHHHQSTTAVANDPDDTSVTSDESDDPASSDDDDDFLWGGMDKDDSDDDRPARSRPERAFMKLHRILQQWITAAAADCIVQGPSSLTTTTTKSPVSDVEASRCAGLQDMIRMHLNTALWEVGLTTEHRKTAESALVPWLTLFDYRYPSPDMDLPLARALTVVFLVLVRVVGSSFATSDTVPPSCQAVGLLLEEYRYLTQSSMSAWASSEEWVTGGL